MGKETTEDPDPVPSLLGITFRRSVSAGRVYLIYGAGISAFWGIALGSAGGSAFSTAFPLILPFFGVTGAIGGLTLFVGDRSKGVLEYLLAYGFSPRRLFTNCLVTSLALASVVLTAAIGAGLGVFLARGGALTQTFAVELALYSVPMTYASVAFASTTGMYWSSLSSPREGMSSPIGLAPVVGLLPSVVTLAAVGASAAAGVHGTTSFLAIVFGSIAVFAGIVAVLVGLVGRLLRRERLLSPA